MCQPSEHSASAESGAIGDTELGGKKSVNALGDSRKPPQRQVSGERGGFFFSFSGQTDGGKRLQREKKSFITVKEYPLLRELNKHGIVSINELTGVRSFVVRVPYSLWSPRMFFGWGRAFLRVCRNS